MRSLKETSEVEVEVGHEAQEKYLESEGGIQSMKETSGI
jgi:hypothetical protein